MFKFSTCLSTHPAEFDAVPFKGNFAENLQKIKNLGFEGVELAIRDPGLIDQEDILRQLNQTGLKAPAIGTGQAWGEEGLSFTDPDAAVRRAAVERVVSHIPFAAQTGAIIIIGLLRGMVRPEVKKENAEAWMKEAFVHCCAQAAGQGVRVVFEPINRYETNLLNDLKGGLKFIDSIGMDNLGILADTFHMNIEEASIEESIRLAGERIFHFHYADSNRLYPGAGHIDFLSVLRALKSINYQGFVSGEHRPDPEPLTAVTRGIRYMRVLDSLVEEQL